MELNFAKPWKNVARREGSVQRPGDSLLLRAETYNLKLTRSLGRGRNALKSGGLTATILAVLWNSLPAGVLRVSKYYRPMVQTSLPFN